MRRSNLGGEPGAGGTVGGERGVPLRSERGALVRASQAAHVGRNGQGGWFQPIWSARGPISAAPSGRGTWLPCLVGRAGADDGSSSISGWAGRLAFGLLDRGV